MPFDGIDPLTNAPSHGRILERTDEHESRLGILATNLAMTTGKVSSRDDRK